MSGSNRFYAPGSPLHGRRVPMDWGHMDVPGQRRALMDYGYAPDFKAACRMMGLHAAAVVRCRRLKLELAASRRHPEGND